MNRILKNVVRNSPTRGQYEYAEKLRNKEFIQFHKQQKPFAVGRGNLRNVGQNERVQSLMQSKRPFLLVSEVNKLPEYSMLKRVCGNSIKIDTFLVKWAMFWKSQLSEKALNKFNTFKLKHGFQNDDLAALYRLYYKNLHMVIDHPNLRKSSDEVHSQSFLLNKCSMGYHLGRSKFDCNYADKTGRTFSRGAMKSLLKNPSKQKLRSKSEELENQLKVINDTVPIDDDLDIVTSIFFNRSALFGADLFNDIYDSFGNFLVSIKLPSNEISDLLLSYRLLMHFARRHEITIRSNDFETIPKPDLYLLLANEKYNSNDSEKNYPFSEKHYKMWQVDAVILLDKNRIDRLNSVLASINQPTRSMDNDFELLNKSRFKECLTLCKNDGSSNVLNKYLIE